MEEKTLDDGQYGSEEQQETKGFGDRTECAFVQLKKFWNKFQTKFCAQRPAGAWALEHERVWKSRKYEN